jgi:hypothetical protein
MELITKADRKLFATDSRFHEVVGDRMKIKVIDSIAVGEYLLDKRIKSNLSNIIELKAINPPKKKEFLHKITYTKDKDFGLYYGIYTGEDRFKNPSWLRIQFDKEYEVFNLSQQDDLQKFAVIIMHPIVKGTPFSNMGTPIFNIFDPKEESQATLNKLEAIPKITQFINDLSGKRLAGFARYMGLHITADTDPVMIKGQLAMMGMEDPFAFISKGQVKNLLFEEIYVNAVDVGVIVEDVEKGYLFNGIYLGSSREEVVNRIKTDSNLANGIMYETDKFDEVAHKFEELVTIKEKQMSAKKAGIGKVTIPSLDDINLDASEGKEKEEGENLTFD